MTLKEVVSVIERVAGRYPSIRTIVENDIYKLNSIADVVYGVFGFIQGEHRERIDERAISYKFTFIYVDRLQENGGNVLDVQTEGIMALSEIVKGVRAEVEREGGDVGGEISYNTFNQRFTDVCAGVMCDVEVDVPFEGCVVEYEDKEIIIK